MGCGGAGLLWGEWGVQTSFVCGGRGAGEQRLECGCRFQAIGGFALLAVFVVVIGLSGGSLQLPLLWNSVSLSQPCLL